MNTDASIIGVDLGGTKVSVGLVRGKTVSRVVRHSVPSQEAADVVLRAVVDSIAEVYDDTVVGIGCGVPSIVDVDEGIVLDVENIPSWKRMPLKAELEQAFGVPATINNDANAFAVGEYIFGKGRGHRTMVGMTLGTGLGTGVIIDGRLYSGANCGAGEIGMMRHKGRVLEDYCSGQLFPREYGVSGEIVFERARSGDELALAAYDRFGRELAEATMVALFAYDPDIVIFGGSISSAFEFFEAGLHRGLEAFPYRQTVERLVITRSVLENAAVLGAAALYVDANNRQ